MIFSSIIVKFSIGIRTFTLLVRVILWEDTPFSRNAVIVTVPGVCAVTKPFSFTDAIVSLLLDQTIVLYDEVDGLIWVTNWCVSPISNSVVTLDAVSVIFKDAVNVFTVTEIVSENSCVG